MIEDVLLLVVIFILIINLIVIIIGNYKIKSSINLSIKEIEKDNNIYKFLHVFKNSLTVVSGYLDKDKINSKQRNIIRSEVRKVLSLINDYSNYNREDNLVVEEIDLSLMFDEIRELLSPLFFKVHGEFIINCNEVYINGYYEELREAFINIIKNSIEAISNNKIIVEVFIKEKRNYVEIIISDNGVGMEREELNNIYNMFYTTKQFGTGVGVPYIKEVISKHFGSIKYLSKKGEGTKVIINLPKKSPKTFNRNN
jgi:signal transduction histidine kinase